MSEENEQTCPFLEKTHLTDIALVVEGKKLFVSKHILAVASPVFNAMFYSNFKEKDTKDIPLPDKMYDDMVSFLKCIYPDCVQPLTMDTVTQVLPLFHEYDCKRQMLKCEKFLIKNIKPYQDIKPDKLMLCLLQSKMYGLPKLYEHCLKSTQIYSLKSLQSTETFKKIQDSIRADLYQKKVLYLESKFMDSLYCSKCSDSYRISEYKKLF